MATNRSAYVGSGRLQEGGALATRKQDFNAHVQGNAFHHNASSINLNTPILGFSNVQSSLEAINDYLINGGTSFVSVGMRDGYVVGSYNVGDADTPTFYDAFNAALTNSRLENGGVVFVLAGTYHLHRTITLPAGISVIGEIGSTYIIAETEESSMFHVEKTDSYVYVGGESNIQGSNIDNTRFANLILIDNLDGYASLTEPCMTTVPMISAQAGANVFCENVSFIGRLHSGPVTGRSKTKTAISYESDVGAISTLYVNNCYFDGLAIGINFNPGGTYLDFLSVTNCKARTFGTESPSSADVDLNCFIFTECCNVNIINNHHIGGGNQVNTMVVFDSIDLLNNSVSVNISGNGGGPYESSGNLVVSLASDTFFMDLSSNTWGTYITTPWTIVVSASSGGSNGTLFGPNAIDMVLQLTAANAFSGTVIVNPGYYTINGTSPSSSNFINLKFIGNKIGQDYPIFNLDLSATGMDTLQNRPLSLGCHIESIHFVSINHRHSIRAASNPTSNTAQNSAHLLEIIDCIFTDTSLYCQSLSIPASWHDPFDNPVPTQINIKDCSFFQTGTFTDTVGLVVPCATQVHIAGCNFSGNGYALNVGANYTNSSNISNIIIENTQFDLTSYTISTSNTFNSSYITVNGGNMLQLKGCQVYASRQYDLVTNIDTALTSSGTFNKFVYLKSKNIEIDGCIFSGPSQTFTSSGVDYAISTVTVEPQNGVRLVNSKFIQGALPLQITGATALNDGSFRDGIVISNCHFASAAFTLMDLDINVLTQTAYTFVVINGCTFQNGTVEYRVKHSQITGLIYNTVGTVQIYSGNSQVNFSNNILNVNIIGITSFTKHAALFINNYDNNSSSGDVRAACTISNNVLEVSSNYAVASAAAYAAAISIKSSNGIVCNNNISFYNNTTVLSSFAGCLVLDIIETSTGSYSDCNVQGNTFSRRNHAGSSSTLSRGYIQITSTSNKTNGGSIMNNSFDASNYNGSSTTLVEDNSAVFSSSAYRTYWRILRNKNQQELVTIPYNCGRHSIHTTANTVLLAGTTSIGSSTISANAIINTVNFNYNNSENLNEFMWIIPLQDVLPPGVAITKLDYTYQISTIPLTTKTLYSKFVSADGTSTATITLGSTSATNASAIPSIVVTTNQNDFCYLIIGANISHSSTAVLAISDLKITYKW